MEDGLGYAGYLAMNRKPPPNTPERGERVRLRGRGERQGVLIKYDPDSQWSTVAWDDGAGPKTCHRYELERAPNVF